jgi:hypothetical protein
MRFTIMGPYRAEPIGSVIVTSSSGTPHATPSFSVTPILEVKTQEGIYVSEATDIKTAGVPVTGGGILYVSDGKLMYRGTNGTVTTVADG